ncbi:integrase/recombinase XerD [Ruminiclostridium sufflavum DSM 19573]|uniref:Integrase/recombinase XerD n=1 Tax=Ruminiclostridium sufflavum DSM 19573 TaxID=1121337 RepID=A0A318XH92_9FIRM|nr:tyrosine-type recombinase/integrase [Ruminiclostridium sufflavum]PYG86550.1 integrase/recombinase XerD [Ruminiclostridium sufflavum DSM 19573]
MLNLYKLTSNYLGYCKYQKNLNDKSLKAYKIDLSQFASFMEGSDGDLNKTNISNYITCLHKTYKPKTVKRKIACLKAFFNYLEYDEIIEKNPFTKMKIKFQEPFLLPKTVSLNTIQAVLSEAYRESQSTNKAGYYYKAVIRDIAVLELLFATGARVSELCSLNVSDVSLCDGFIKIYGKGSRERIVQIGNDEVILALRNYRIAFPSKNNANDFFFINRLGNRLSEQSVRLMITKYVDKAGLQVHITPHMYRHSLATLLLEEDVDIRYIQHILGHSSIVTTQIYTHVTSNKQKSILVAKHPRNKVVLDKGQI